ncbi:hypothetical protein ABHN03_04050 [Paenibacillus sp. NRS-1775]|uniref:hypothetical protein n=1 Tax=unclassified Paenibacillus TaxID=185978 RepID=UPI003D27E8A8
MKNRIINTLILLFTYILGRIISDNFVPSDHWFLAGGITVITAYFLRDILDYMKNKSL